MRREFVADISEEGDIKFRNRAGWKAAKDFFKSSVVIIGIEKFKKKRTLQQNKAVMGLWMPIILDELGYPRYESKRVYEWLKLQCWYEDIAAPNGGQMMRVAKETHEDDTEEYGIFMETFRTWIREFFLIELPDPDPMKARL